MKKGDFMKVLESFPGTEELKRCKDYEGLFLRYAYIDFERVGKLIARGKINLPKNAEIWTKFIAFFAIAGELHAAMPPTKEILTVKSQEIEKNIIEKFNATYFNSQNIIQGIGGISLKELIDFAKKGENIFD